MPTPVPAHARILAIDLGERRMGLALSDPLHITAQGLPTAERRNKREDMNFIKSLLKKHAASLVVLGHPINMDGSHGPRAEHAERFAASLAKHAGVRVELWDERLTSVEAHHLMRDSGLGHQQRGKNVDQMAATLLLQNYLESERMKAGTGFDQATFDPALGE
ncbi:MAG: Holliday junction resolvase RuvX [Acidobacteria bacterium]|nr:Holliday junction resolvase RuvX [Acidobacteriota bacterium]